MQSMLIVALEHKSLYFGKVFSKYQELIQEPLTHYKAYLYLFKCTFHAQSKYSNENLKIEKVQKKNGSFDVCMSSSTPAWGGLML